MLRSLSFLRSFSTVISASRIFLVSYTKPHSITPPTSTYTYSINMSTTISIDGKEVWPKIGYGAMGVLFSHSALRILLGHLHRTLTSIGLSGMYGAPGTDEEGKAVLRKAIEIGCTMWSTFFPSSCAFSRLLMLRFLAHRHVRLFLSCHSQEFPVFALFPTLRAYKITS